MRCACGSPSSLQLLVEKGASAKARNRDDNTPREESDDPAVKEFLRALE